MADPNWVFVERLRGRMRRVTVLDDQLNIISTHERDLALADVEPDDCQLLRAVELGRFSQTA